MREPLSVTESRVFRVLGVLTGAGESTVGGLSGNETGEGDEGSDGDGGTHVD